jgi:hypothetical protein
MAIVRLEGLGKSKISDDLIGNRTRDLPTCSLVSQPTTLPKYVSIIAGRYVGCTVVTTVHT